MAIELDLHQELTGGLATGGMKGGPDGRGRRASPPGRGDPEDAGRVLRPSPSQSVAAGLGGRHGGPGPQGATSTERGPERPGPMDPRRLRLVARLTDWTGPGVHCWRRNPRSSALTA